MSYSISPFAWDSEEVQQLTTGRHVVPPLLMNITESQGSLPSLSPPTLSTPWFPSESKQEGDEVEDGEDEEKDEEMEEKAIADESAFELVHFEYRIACDCLSGCVDCASQSGDSVDHTAPPSSSELPNGSSILGTSSPLISPNPQGVGLDTFMQHAQFRTQRVVVSGAAADEEKDDGVRSYSRIEMPARISQAQPKRGFRQPWECNVCHQTLISDRRRHMNTHVNENMYFCWICFKGSRQPSNLNLHRCNHASRQFRCETHGCLFRALTQEELNKHVCADRSFLVIDSRRIPADDVLANPEAFTYVPPQAVSNNSEVRLERKRTSSESVGADDPERRVKPRFD